MGIRFRRSIKILPGLRLNFSNSGVSTTLGGGGVSVNAKAGRKMRVTYSAPGTGLSLTENLEGRQSTRTLASSEHIAQVAAPSRPVLTWRTIVHGMCALLIVCGTAQLLASNWGGALGLLAAGLLLLTVSLVVTSLPFEGPR